MSWWSSSRRRGRSGSAATACISISVTTSRRTRTRSSVPTHDEAALLPDWVQLDRIDGIDEVPGYDQQLVAAVLREYVQGGAGEHLLPRVNAAAEAIGERIVETWERLDVSFVMVENGTLPENVTYTKGALLGHRTLRQPPPVSAASCSGATTT